MILRACFWFLLAVYPPFAQGRYRTNQNTVRYVLSFLLAVLWGSRSAPDIDGAADDTQYPSGFIEVYEVTC